MNKRKQEVMEKLRSMGIDPVKVEKDVVRIMRTKSPSIEVRNYFKKLLEGGAK